MAHAFFSPSSAPRVVRCPGSLLLTLGMPDQQSVDAAHGTAAHWIADLCLRHNSKTSKYGGCVVAVSKTGECCFRHIGNETHIDLETAFGNYLLFDVDEEMEIAVQEYVDWCNDAPGDKYPEQRVDISRWTPDPDPNDPFDAAYFVPQAFEPQFGTSDHGACSPGRLIITDLKYGMGVKVFAHENEQAILYALGFIDEWDWLYEFEEVEIRICQPRIDHKDVWITTKAELQKKGEWIKAQFTLALKPDAPFQAGEKQCKFCRASGQCRPQAEYLSKLRALAFDDLDAMEKAVNKNLLTPDELVEAWKAKKLYDSAFDNLTRILSRRLEAGEAVPGLRRVEARTHRQWVNQKDAVDDLLFLGLTEKNIYKEVKIISPNQASKLLPKAERTKIDAMVYKPRGEPCIVDADDKRPDYGATSEQANEAFADLDDPFA